MSSALLAVQGGNVLYGRMAHQTPGAMLFIVLALYFYVKARQGKDKPTSLFIISAACLGFAFAVHPSTAYIVPVFILMELHHFLSGPSNIPFCEKAALITKNLATFFGAFAYTVLMWEVPRFLTHIYFISIKCFKTVTFF